MRRIGVLAVLFALIVAGCTGGDDVTATPGTSPSSTTEPSVVPTAAASASATSTLTLTPTPEPTPGQVPGNEYGVVNVHRNDPDGGLNVRVEPVLTSAVIGVIPPNAVGIVSRVQIDGGDGAVLHEVTYEGVSGWVSGRFLTPLPSFDAVSCGDPATDYALSPGAVPDSPAPEDPEADHVFSIHHAVGPDCERTVITFGRDYSIDADLDQALETADGVPSGLGLSIDLGEVRVALPEAVVAAASTASETLRRDNGGADLLFVRPAAGSGFGIVGLWDRNRGVRYFYLENPGRLVIDTIDAPTGSAIALGALVSEGRFSLTVLPRPINLEPDGPPPEPPIEVVAYSRPFEASATIRLRTAPLEGAAPGGGDLVSADWSGSTFADSCGSTYAVMTTDYIEAWGELSFAIEALAPGTYELFVGEDSAQDGRELGVYHVFTVGGSTVASC